MNKPINQDLKEYIETQILPIYLKNEEGHGLQHIEYVLRRSLKFAEQIPNLNINIVYIQAAFHDIAHHIDKDNHEKLSAQMFYQDDNIKRYFNEEERTIIKEAIEDHRASLETEPRSIYGKILSSADRTTNIEAFMKRTYTYTKKHFKEADEEQIVDRAYQHLQEKYGNHGYAKMYVDDSEYQAFKDEIQELLNNKEKFKTKYLKVNKLKK